MKKPFPAYNFKKSGEEDFLISLMKFAFSLLFPLGKRRGPLFEQT